MIKNNGKIRNYNFIHSLFYFSKKNNILTIGNNQNIWKIAIQHLLSQWQKEIHQS